jgi:hypothetical protein
VGVELVLVQERESVPGDLEVQVEVDPMISFSLRVASKGADA